MPDMELKVTITAKQTKGHVADPKAWGKHIAEEFTRWIESEEGPELDVIDIKIEKKLDGYESIGSFNRT